MAGESSTDVPVSIDLDRTKALRIAWADGQETVYPLTVLRQACPCASCREAREERQKNPLSVVQTPDRQRDMVIAERIELVGRYALRVTWRDGHDAGIYDYEMLRSLPAGGPG